MINRTLALFAVIVTMLSLAGGPVRAAGNAPLTPEYAAKKENFRKQNEQRITQDKRTAAAEALKAERVRVYNAKQAVKHTKQQPSDIK